MPVANARSLPENHTLLVVGDWLYPMYERAIARGFEHCGWRVCRFQIAPYLAHNSFFQKFERKLMFSWMPVIHRLNRDLIQVISVCSPRAIFFFNTTLITEQTYQKVSRLPDHPLLITYNHDNPFEDGRRFFWRHYFSGLRYSDCNFFCRERSVRLADAFGGRSNHLLMQYYVDDMHRPLPDVDVTWKNDVVFIGHYEPDGRGEIVEYLLKNCVDLKIFGSRWQEAAHECPSLDVSGIKPVEGDDYVAALCGAKIALVFMSQKNKDPYTTRCFEIPACGTFMLAPRTSELESLFQDRKEAVFFDTKEDLLEAIRFYLKNEDARREIARAGRERVVRSGHSNLDRARRVLDIAGFI